MNKSDCQEWNDQRLRNGKYLMTYVKTNILINPVCGSNRLIHGSCASLYFAVVSGKVTPDGRPLLWKTVIRTLCETILIM